MKYDMKHLIQLTQSKNFTNITTLEWSVSSYRGA